MINYGYYNDIKECWDLRGKVKFVYGLSFD